MFRKVHIRLTMLCTGITAVIMITMSLFYLHISETGLYDNQFQAFQNDINTITTNLEQQSVISMEWLSKMESQGNYSFYLLDNGIPFLYNQLRGGVETSQKNTLLEESLAARGTLEITSSLPWLSSMYTFYHTEYEFTSASTNTKYFGSTIYVKRASSPLEVVVLSSLSSLEKQINEQRLRFLLIDFAAVLLLTAFSWIFTGKLLKPIIESQQKQNQFIASASHELRTPLAVILSAAECCKTSPSEKREKFLKTIASEGARMSALVNDMLTLSGSDNHQLMIEKKPVELDTLLMNSYEAFEPLAKEKEISLSVHIPESALPPCPADPDRISQVLSILLHNAISYTPKHGEISLSLAYRREHFYLFVSDNGIGISDEDKKKIFDRFYRAEKSRSDKEHFGLGLPIAYEIMKAHGGSIEVADAAGGGSVFTVVI
ncbi:MAG: HAMP domain-containing histidine kinase [Blautia sp.]|nr:HAMP domain-containing histidine kinase [Lachnoclostridium sp.]MCM1211901.1 HAMP domain-containing histidine kinase [Blautia sp.]